MSVCWSAGLALRSKARAVWRARLWFRCQAGDGREERLLLSFVFAKGWGCKKLALEPSFGGSKASGGLFSSKRGFFHLLNKKRKLQKLTVWDFFRTHSYRFSLIIQIPTPASRFRLPPLQTVHAASGLPDLWWIPRSAFRVFCGVGPRSP